MKRFLDTFNPLLKKAIMIPLWFTLSVAVLVIVIEMILVVAYPYVLDYGEGPLLDQAVRIHEGETLYSTDITQPPYTITNYPPVYVGLLSLFNSRESASLLPGRILSTLATLGTAFFIFQIIYHTKKDWFAGVVAAVLFLSFPYVFRWGGLMRVDNLALLFAVAAIFVLVRWHDRPWVLWATAVLLTLAAYTRQSYLLAAPFACGVYLLFKDWKKAFQLAIITVLLVGALFGLFMLTTDGGFWQHIGVANVNTFKWETVNNYITELTDEFLITSLIAGVFLFVGWKLMDEWKFAAPFLLGAVASAITVGKIGSNVNYLLELVAAMSIALGLLYAWIRTEEKQVFKWLNIPIVHTLVLMVFALLVIGQMRSMLQRDLNWEVGDVKERRLAKEVIESMDKLVQDTEGPILITEHMSMLPRNGKSIYLQPFEMTQLANDGFWDQTPLLEEIEQKNFDLIVFHKYDGERWTDEMRETIMANYAANYYFANSTVFTPVAEGEPGADAVLDCQPATGWITPTSGEMGAFWFTRQLFIAGGGDLGETPVYAAADGLLYRFEEWSGAVAIQHDDPLNPSEKIWTYYGHMRDPWNEEIQYIVEDFPIGAEAIPVKQGDLIGYQGAIPSQYGTNARLHFAIVPADADGNFPVQWMQLPEDSTAYHPNPTNFDSLMIKKIGEYLGIVPDTSAGMLSWKPYRCAVDTQGGE